MNDFSETSRIILNELSQSLSAVNEEQAKTIAHQLMTAQKVFVVGVGRVMLMLQAFAKRLNHLGIPAYYVGENNEPAITEKDVLFIASGSGESIFPVAIGKVALKYHPAIVYVGSNPESSIANMADHIMRIPCKTKLKRPDEIQSVQPMTSLFEQSLLLSLDTIAMMIAEDKQLVMEDLWMTHANLE